MDKLLKPASEPVKEVKTQDGDDTKTVLQLNLDENVEVKTEEKVKEEVKPIIHEDKVPTLNNISDDQFFDDFFDD